MKINNKKKSLPLPLILYSPNIPETSSLTKTKVHYPLSDESAKESEGKETKMEIQ